MRGLLYIGRVYTKSIIKFTAWLFVGLAINNIIGVKGVADCAGPLRTTFAIPMV